MDGKDVDHAGRQPSGPSAPGSSIGEDSRGRSLLSSPREEMNADDMLSDASDMELSNPDDEPDEHVAETVRDWQGDWLLQKIMFHPLVDDGPSAAANLAMSVWESDFASNDAPANAEDNAEQAQPTGRADAQSAWGNYQEEPSDNSGWNSGPSDENTNTGWQSHPTDRQMGDDEADGINEPAVENAVANGWGDAPAVGNAVVNGWGDAPAVENAAGTGWGDVPAAKNAAGTGWGETPAAGRNAGGWG